MNENGTTEIHPCYSSRELTVGSHAQGAYSVVSKACISSAVSSKSYTSAFSSMRESVTDLGNGTNPYTTKVSLVNQFQ